MDAWMPDGEGILGPGGEGERRRGSKHQTPSKLEGFGGYGRGAPVDLPTTIFFNVIDRLFKGFPRVCFYRFYLLQHSVVDTFINFCF